MYEMKRKDLMASTVKEQNVNEHSYDGLVSLQVHLMCSATCLVLKERYTYNLNEYTVHIPAQSSPLHYILMIVL